MKKSFIILSCALLASGAFAQGQGVKDRLKAHVYTLASEEFAGRKPNIFVNKILIARCFVLCKYR